MQFGWFKRVRVGASRRRRSRRRGGAPSIQHYILHKERARALVHERLSHWNQFYSHTYNRVTIRNQRSRWGSCSSKQNLNFNYRIIFLPQELVDYIIVHELCHLAEFNHSQNFWSHVARTLPDYASRRAQLGALSVEWVVKGVADPVQ